MGIAKSARVHDMQALLPEQDALPQRRVPKHRRP